MIASRLPVVTLLGALTLAGCASEPATFTMDGSLVLQGTITTTLTGTVDKCTGSGGFSDLTSGAAITVKDAGGKTVALGALTSGTGSSSNHGYIDRCTYDIKVLNVPVGSSFYSVTVAHRDGLTISAEDARAGRLVLAIGH